jgi:hypothetical protein
LWKKVLVCDENRKRLVQIGLKWNEKRGIMSSGISVEVDAIEVDKFFVGIGDSFLGFI